MNFLKALIFNRTVLVLLIAACLVVTALDMYFDNSQTKVVNFAALEIAKNDLTLVSRLSADLKKELGTAQAAKMSDEAVVALFNTRLKESGSPVKIQLITQTSEKDEFQKQAHQMLQQSPSQPFYNMEITHGDESFRYALIFPPLGDFLGNNKAILELVIPMSSFADMQDWEALKTLWVLVGMAILSSISLAIFVAQLRHTAQTIAKTQEKALDEQKQLTYAYERFFPHQFLILLDKKNILDINLGDHAEKKLAVLFADIRNFTSLIEKKTPAESFQFINEYLSQVSPIIRNHSGFIDKYIGDAIMALFERSEDAILATIKMMNLLQISAGKPENLSRAVAEIGVGLHFGSLMVGTVGEKERMDGTVISDIVNTASRLEGLNKFYGTHILVSEKVVNNLLNKEKFRIRYIDHVYVKGKSDDIKIYEIFDVDSPDLIERKELAKTDYEKAIECYRNRQFEEAIQHLQKCQQILPNDLVVTLYIKRCTRLAAESLISAMSPESWSPIARLSQKDIVE
jgi:class 3 adenylate cyclase